MKLLKSLIKTGLRTLFPLSFKIFAESLILVFHGVIKEDFVDYRIQSNQIKVKEFERIIKFLFKHYKFISLDELEFNLKKNIAQKGNCVLTFDDGYQNIFSVVEPILSEYSIPFSVFVNTGYINSDMRLPSYYAKVALLNTEKKQFYLTNFSEKFDIKGEDSRHYYLDRILEKMKSLRFNELNLVLRDLKNLIPEERWAELNNLFKSEQLLTWDEIIQLSKKGAIIGSHGHEHCILHQFKNED